MRRVLDRVILEIKWLALAAGLITGAFWLAAQLRDLTDKLIASLT